VQPQKTYKLNKIVTAVIIIAITVGLLMLLITYVVIPVLLRNNGRRTDIRTQSNLDQTQNNLSQNSSNLINENEDLESKKNENQTQSSETQDTSKNQTSNISKPKEENLGAQFENTKPDYNQNKNRGSFEEFEKAYKI
jgi:cytoskeletal protein RodZ